MATSQTPMLNMWYWLWGQEAIAEHENWWDRCEDPTIPVYKPDWRKRKQIWEREAA